MPDISTLTFLCRTNTVCVDVNAAYPGGRCPRKEWVLFLKKELGLRAQDMVETQVHSITNYLMVKLKNEDMFNACLEKLRKGVLWNTVKQLVYGWSTQEVLVTVRIINLSCHIDVEKVKSKMGEYGQIAWSKLGYHQDLPGVRDGTLTLRMKINEDSTLPSFLELGNMGECLQIFSDASEKVCFKCSRPGHISAFCRAKPKTVSQETSSWARIVDGNIPSNPTVIPSTDAVVLEAPSVLDKLVPDPGNATTGVVVPSLVPRSSPPSSVELASTSPRQVTGKPSSSATTGVVSPSQVTRSSPPSKIGLVPTSPSQGTGEKSTSAVETSSSELDLPLGQGRKDSASPLQVTESLSLLDKCSMDYSNDEGENPSNVIEEFPSPGNSSETGSMSKSPNLRSCVSGVATLPSSPGRKADKKRKKRVGSSPDPNLIRELNEKKNKVMAQI